MAFFRAIAQITTRHSQIPKSTFSQTLRFNTTISHHNHHQSTHAYLDPNDYVGSWETPKTPKEAEAKLAQLRRDYAKKVKAMRKEYAQEMELQRIEKTMKDETMNEELRKANEERKRIKAVAAEARAAERKVAQEEFRQTLMKERAEKLENWRMKEKKRIENRKEKNELIRRQSSLFVSESDIEKKVLEAIVVSTPL